MIASHDLSRGKDGVNAFGVHTERWGGKSRIIIDFRHFLHLTGGVFPSKLTVFDVKTKDGAFIFIGSRQEDIVAPNDRRVVAGQGDGDIPLLLEVPFGGQCVGVRQDGAAELRPLAFLCFQGGRQINLFNGSRRLIGRGDFRRRWLRRR